MKRWVWLWEHEEVEAGEQTGVMVFAAKWMADSYGAARIREWYPGLEWPASDAKTIERYNDDSLKYDGLMSVYRARLNRFVRKEASE